jgi:hypothetical protein
MILDKTPCCGHPQARRRRGKFTPLGSCDFRKAVGTCCLYFRACRREIPYSLAISVEVGFSRPIQPWGTTVSPATGGPSRSSIGVKGRHREMHRCPTASALPVTAHFATSISRKSRSQVYASTVCRWPGSGSLKQSSSRRSGACDL